MNHANKQKQNPNEAMEHLFGPVDLEETIFRKGNGVVRDALMVQGEACDWVDFDGCHAVERRVGGKREVWRFVRGGGEQLAWPVDYGFPALAAALHDKMEGRQEPLPEELREALAFEPLMMALAGVRDNLWVLMTPGHDDRTFWDLLAGNPVDSRAMATAFANRLTELALAAREAGNPSLMGLLADAGVMVVEEGAAVFGVPLSDLRLAGLALAVLAGTGSTEDELVAASGSA